MNPLLEKIQLNIPQALLEELWGPGHSWVG